MRYKKRIGILTFHTQYNYGSALQAFALQKAITKLNYDNRIINYYYQKDMALYGIRWHAGLKVIFFDILTFPFSYMKKQAYKKFTKQYLDLTEEVRSVEGVKKLAQRFDTLLCGSDQIWNMEIVEGVNPVYFLRFANKDQRKVAYAPSIAVKGSIDKNKDALREALSDFYALSIREESFIDDLSTISGREVRSVLDPTLLLEAEDYEQLIQDYSVCLPDKYIFMYCIHHGNLVALSKVAEKMAKDKNLRIVYFNKYPILKEKYAKNIFTKDPRAFLVAIKNASYVLSDSFHAGVFSMIYGRQFITKAMDDSKSRMDDFFEKLNIGDRHLNEEDYHMPFIDYQVVHKYWKKEKEKSWEYLQLALGDRENHGNSRFI